MDFPKAKKGFCANIPHRYILNLGRMLGFLWYMCDAPHRRIVKRNLKFAHPDWSSDYIQKLAKHIFQHVGITILEIIQMSFFSREDMLSRVRMKGEENLIEALKRGQGVIVVSAHLGNWEMGLQFAPCYLHKPITGVAKKVRLSWLNRWIHNLRTRFGNKIIYKKGALPEMTQTLRQREILGLLIDQSRRSEGVETTFFGRKVTTTTAVVMLAIRCKSPVVPVFCIREKDGQLTIIAEPALAIKRTKDLRFDLQTNTQMMTDVVEQAVRKYPEQWFWFHKRWKKFYPDLYPEYQTRRQRRKEKNIRRSQSGAS